MALARKVVQWARSRSLFSARWHKDQALRFGFQVESLRISCSSAVRKFFLEMAY